MAGSRLLIVEDDQGICNATEELLRLHGYDVRCAKDGLEALALMQEHTPDLILADIIMPKMNGYQFYERVRRKAEWSWIPFIFMTVKSSDEDLRFGRELGVDDYLLKPFDPEDLLAAVRSRLERFEQLAKTEKDPGILIHDARDIAALRNCLLSLSEREREVLMLICGGLSNHDIAKRLFVTVSTVKTQVAHILSKLGVGTRTEAASVAHQAGLELLDDPRQGSM